MVSTAAAAAAATATAAAATATATEYVLISEKLAVHCGVSYHKSIECSLDVADTSAPGSPSRALHVHVVLRNN